MSKPSLFVVAFVCFVTLCSECFASTSTVAELSSRPGFGLNRTQNYSLPFPTRPNPERPFPPRTREDSLQGLRAFRGQMIENFANTNLFFARGILEYDDRIQGYKRLASKSRAKGDEQDARAWERLAVRTRTNQSSALERLLTLLTKDIEKLEKALVFDRRNGEIGIVHRREELLSEVKEMHVMLGKRVQATRQWALLLKMMSGPASLGRTAVRFR